MYDAFQLRGLKLLSGEDGMVQIKGLNEVTVNNVQDILNVLEMGRKNRQVAETKANSHSSRSHAILEVSINNEPKSFSDGATALKSILYFVDLAGSESLDNTGPNKSRQREGAIIKKSLVTLNKCIDILKSDSNQGHISYRDSVLTRVLQPCFRRRDARITIISCINPAHVEESKRTLNFAFRASQIETNARINEIALSAPFVNNENVHRLVEDTVDSAPNAIDTTSTELLDQICSLKDEVAAQNAELADKGAEIKRLQDALQMSWDHSSGDIIEETGREKELRQSDSHLIRVSASSKSGNSSGGDVNSGFGIHRDALVHKSSVIGELQIELEGSQAEAKRLRSELDDKDDRVAELEATVAELKSCNADLCNECGSLRAESIESERRIAEFVSIEEKLVAEAEILDDELVSSAKRVLELDIQREEDAERRKQLEEEIEMLRNTNASLEQQVEELLRKEGALANKVRLLSEENYQLRREQEETTAANVDVGVPISDEDSCDVHYDDDGGEAVRGNPDDIGDDTDSCDDTDSSVHDNDSYDVCDDDDDEAAVEKLMSVSDESVDGNYSGCEWSDEDIDSVCDQSEEICRTYGEDDHVENVGALSNNVYESTDEESSPIADAQSFKLREVQDDDSFGGIGIVKGATGAIDQDDGDDSFPPPPPLPGQVVEARSLPITHKGGFQPNDERWHERYRQLIEYKEEQGDCLVSRGDEKYKKLGQWVGTQRKQYCLLQEGKKSQITEERIAKLEEIGFDWNPQETAWKSMFSALIEYKEEHGNCLVPQGDEKNKKLGVWANEQRTQYRRRLLQDGKESQITEERVAKLNGIGFVWNPQETAWKSMFKKLVEYKEEQGDCLVPSGYVVDNKKLGLWVGTQRKQYRLLQKGKPSQITEERIAKLKETGFVWNPQETAWKSMFKKLVEYKAEHGDCLVARNDAKNKKLGRWVKYQRDHYRLLQKGKPSQITEERVAKLEGIGFRWSLKD